MLSTSSPPSARQPKQLGALPFLPLLLLLHLLFTCLSLLRRTYELLLFRSRSSSSSRSSSPASSLSSSPARSQSVQIPPPKHLALALIPSSRSSRAERKALVESVRRAVRWCGREGVRELSIWDGGSGLLKSATSTLMQDLLRLPPSPPGSGADTPPRHAPAEADLSQQVQSHLQEPTSLTVFPNGSSTALLLHLLPAHPSTSSDPLPALAASYAAKQLPPDNITQEKLDEDIMRILHFQSPPALLLIHHLSPLSFPRSLLPRPAPELHRYPWWTLRLTEIYQHPPSLPLPSIPLPHLLVRAQDSSLPLLRKVARLFPPAYDWQNEGVVGALGRDEWEGAMAAWGGVEQRLGR